MKYLKLCFFISICFPIIITHAERTGDIIYIHPDNEKELWSTSSWDGRDAHRIFTHSHGIEHIAVQKNGPYLLMIAHARVNGRLGRDVFLVDRTRPRAKARNLTQQRYGPIEDIDIFHNGDVVFLNSSEVENLVHGIYLIPREELGNDLPETELLRSGGDILNVRLHWDFSKVRCSPDNEHIAYNAGGKIYLYNVIKGGGSKGVTEGHFPVFSPEGDRLAFAHRFKGMNAAISVISIKPLNLARRLATVAPVDHVSSGAFIWAPDGQAIIYTARGFDRLFHSYRAPLDGGPHEEIFEHLAESPYDFDWTGTPDPHAVEPTRKLTTLWGSLKVHNIRHR